MILMYNCIWMQMNTTSRTDSLDWHICGNCGCVILYIGRGFILLLEIVFTCRNVIGRRIAMTIHDVMGDVRQARQQAGR